MSQIRRSYTSYLPRSTPQREPTVYQAAAAVGRLALCPSRTRGPAGIVMDPYVGLFVSPVPLPNALLSLYAAHIITLTSRYMYKGTHYLLVYIYNNSTTSSMVKPIRLGAPSCFSFLLGKYASVTSYICSYTWNVLCCRTSTYKNKKVL